MIERLIIKLELRDGLAAAERRDLEQMMSPPRRFSAGEDMVLQGSEPKESTLLLQGVAGRYTTLEDGRQQITAVHLPGDFVDLHSFLIRKMDHSIAALTDCVIATAPHAALRAATDASPHLGRLLWLSTLIDAAIHRMWLVSMGRRTSAAQLAHLLCELLVRLRVVGLARDNAFEFGLSQAQLANVLGLSTVHVNRVLQELRGRGLVAWAGSRVEILDWDGLVKAAEFDPTYLQLEPTPV